MKTIYPKLIISSYRSSQIVMGNKEINFELCPCEMYLKFIQIYVKLTEN